MLRTESHPPGIWSCVLTAVTAVRPPVPYAFSNCPNFKYTDFAFCACNKSTQARNLNKYKAVKDLYCDNLHYKKPFANRFVPEINKHLDGNLVCDDTEESYSERKHEMGLLQFWWILSNLLQNWHVGAMIFVLQKLTLLIICFFQQKICWLKLFFIDVGGVFCFHKYTNVTDKYNLPVIKQRISVRNVEEEETDVKIKVYVCVIYGCLCYLAEDNYPWCHTGCTRIWSRVPQKWLYITVG